MLYGWMLIGSGYGVQTWEESTARLVDGARLIFIPIIIYYVRDGLVSKGVMSAFMTAMGVTLIAGMMKMYLNVPIGLKYTEAAVFKTHIATNFFMVLGAFYVAFFAFRIKAYRWPLIILAMAMIYYVFFMSLGRIGYLAAFVLGLYTAYTFYGKKAFFLSLLALMLLGSMLYIFSEVFQVRMDHLLRDWLYYEQNRISESSLGSRLQFDLASIQLFLKHPLLGWGTGSFETAYQSFVAIGHLPTDNPHNEFLRVGVEHGLIGLALLGYMVFKQWQLFKNLPNDFQFLAKGSLLLFLVGCFFNSWLMDFTESYYYVLMTAMSLSTVKLLQPGDLVTARLHS